MGFSYVAGPTSVIQIFITLYFNILIFILNVPIFGNAITYYKTRVKPHVQDALEYMSKVKSAYNLAFEPA